MAYLVRAQDRAPAVTTPVDPDPTLPRACIIGGGSSGIAAAKQLYLARVPFDWFEQGLVLGGNWVLDNPNGVSACYESLEINTSCPRMAFSDFPMPADYPDYARHDQVAAYFEEYVDHFGLRDRVTFGTRVEKVVPVEGDRWAVTVVGPEGEWTEGERTEVYDAVLVCNGHHWKARWPDYPGTFDGEQLHAHDYRGAAQLAGRDVVVVGAGNSAMDISVAGLGAARSVTVSQRRGEWVLRKHLLGRPVDQVGLPSWAPWWATRARLTLGVLLSGNRDRGDLPRPDHAPGTSHPVQSASFLDAVRAGQIQVRPGIERLAGDRVEFVDGSSVAADLIVWATGYEVAFPFLEEVLTVEGNDLPLWFRTVHPDHPGLFFIGLAQPVGAIMPIAEAQSAWVAEQLTGAYLPPPTEEVRRDLRRTDAAYKKRFYAGERHTMQVDFDHYLWSLERERRRGRRRAADGRGGQIPTVRRN